MAKNYDQIIQRLLLQNVKPFLEASFNGDINTVKVLRNKVDIDVVDDNGDSALILACLRGHENIVKFLLREKANYNLQNEFGSSAMMIACSKNYKNIIKILLQVRADINLKDKNGMSALMVASNKGYLDIAKMLLEAGAQYDDVNQDNTSALITASHMGHENIVKLLLEYKANCNTQNKDGMSALMVACIKGNTNIIKFLISYGADMNAEDIYGHSPIIRAAFAGKENIVKILLASGADVSFINKLDSGYVKIQNKISQDIPSTAKAIKQAARIDELFSQNNAHNYIFDYKNLEMLSNRFDNILKNKQKIDILDYQLKQVIENNFAKSPFQSIYGSTKYFAKNITTLTFKAAISVANNITDGTISHDKGAEIYKYLSKLPDNITNIIVTQLQNSVPKAIYEYLKHNLQNQKDIDFVMNHDVQSDSTVTVDNQTNNSICNVQKQDQIQQDKYHDITNTISEIDMTRKDNLLKEIYDDISEQIQYQKDVNNIIYIAKEMNEAFIAGQGSNLGEEG